MAPKSREDYLPGCLTPLEVAQTYGISESVVWTAMQSRRLASRINRFEARMVTPEACDAWAQANGYVPRAHTPSWIKGNG